MNKSDLKTLLGDLQNAKVGTRELSDRCLKAMGWEQRKSKVHPSVTFWRSKEQAEAAEPFGECHLPRPDPSCDTQDALDWMVPKGWRLKNMDYGLKDCWATLVALGDMACGASLKAYSSMAPTLPLAIVIARIKLELDKPDGS